MSQDLFAEFGSFTLSNRPQQDGAITQSPSFPSRPNNTTHPIAYRQKPAPDILSDGIKETACAEDDEDDFGDFEAAGQGDIIEGEVFGHEQQQHHHHKEAETPLHVLHSTTAKKSISAPDFKPNRSAKVLSSSHPFAGNMDVLFDAEDSDEMLEAAEEADDDDFGEFETTAAPTPAPAPAPPSKAHPTPSQSVLSKPQNSATFDLLGLEEEISPPAQGHKEPITTSPAPSQGQPPTRKTVSRPRTTKPQASNTQSVPDDDFAAWDDFESTPVQAAKPKQPPPPESQSPAARIGDLIKLPSELVGNLLAPAPSSSPPAPSNIPPPSLLLSLFPPLFAATSTHLLHPLTSLSADQKHAFLTCSPAQTFLKSYLTAAHVLSHVIAGRKNRWKRDKYLAQSMRIGPSVSGRSGGMKLAGLDTNESRREDSEVEDVLRVWREQLGRLRSAITGAAAGGAAKKALPVVPELASVMPIRIAKQAESGVVSTVACALCGLKREERVAKVDVDVEDSFGEWWMEKTNMHLGCWNFWDKHKSSLKGR